jgi:hypothetical protein
MGIHDCTFTCKREFRDILSCIIIIIILCQNLDWKPSKQFQGCQKCSYSLAIWNLGTNVVPENIMAPLKYLSQISFWMHPVRR